MRLNKTVSAGSIIAANAEKHGIYIDKPAAYP